MSCGLDNDYGAGVKVKEIATPKTELPNDYLQVTVTADGEIREIDINSVYYARFVLKMRCDKDTYQIGAQLIPRIKDSVERDLLVACVKLAPPTPPPVVENAE